LQILQFCTTAFNIIIYIKFLLMKKQEENMTRRKLFFTHSISVFLFLSVIELALPVNAAVIVQGGGDNYIAFQAEDADSILNPDAADDVQNSVLTGSAESPAQVFEIVSDGQALGGSALESPSTPHRQQTQGGPQESIAVFLLEFANAGTYRLYVRARNNGTPGNGASDSIWVGSAFGSATPDEQTNLGSTGSFAWVEESINLTVNPGDVGNTLEFRISVRESDARADALVVSTTSGLTETQLDDLFGGAPPANLVTNVAELHAALASALPGDKIIMQDGIWNDSDIVFDGGDSANGTGGTAGNPIILQPQTLGGAVLEGCTRLRIAGEYMVVDGLNFENGEACSSTVIEFRNGSSNLAENCRLTNTSMINFNPASATTDYDWVGIYGFNNRVDHCYFSGMNHIGVQMVIWPVSGGPANNHLIDYNYFGDRAQGTGNGFETIRIGTSTVSNQNCDTIVENNYFYRCDGEIEIISNKTVGNIYRYNTFVECDGQLTLRHGGACEVYGNFFFGNNVSGSSGVRIVGPDHVVYNNYFQDLNGTGFRGALVMMNGVPSSPLNRYLQVERALVAFNTFVNCREVFAIGEQSSDGDTILPPDDCVIANNVVQSNGSTDIITYTDTPTSFTYQGNFMHGTSLGITNPGGISTSDPMLVVAADSLYRPDTLSPVIDGSVGSYSTITDDMDGHARDDATKDSGADEVRGTTPPRGPLTPSDVGPTVLVPVEVSGFLLD
jgi:poly(beta-D-mannuronate) lyase